VAATVVEPINRASFMNATPAKRLVEGKDVHCSRRLPAAARRG
jgi:hypothetical protein